MATTTSIGTKKCTPFQLQVKVVSPESGYRFAIEIQKACDSENQPVWKLLFDLDKKLDSKYENLISISFVAGNTNDIAKIAAITEDGMTRSQVRAFKDNVYPLAKQFGDAGKTPTATQTKSIDKSIQAAINS